MPLTRTTTPLLAPFARCEFSYQRSVLGPPSAIGSFVAVRQRFEFIQSYL